MGIEEFIALCKSHRAKIVLLYIGIICFGVTIIISFIEVPTVFYKVLRIIISSICLYMLYYGNEKPYLYKYISKNYNSFNIEYPKQYTSSFFFFMIFYNPLTRIYIQHEIIWIYLDLIGVILFYLAIRAENKIEKDVFWCAVKLADKVSLYKASFNDQNHPAKVIFNIANYWRNQLVSENIPKGKDEKWLICLFCELYTLSLYFNKEKQFEDIYYYSRYYRFIGNERLRRYQNNKWETFNDNNNHYFEEDFQILSSSKHFLDKIYLVYAVDKLHLAQWIYDDIYAEYVYEQAISPAKENIKKALIAEENIKKHIELNGNSAISSKLLENSFIDQSAKEPNVCISHDTLNEIIKAMNLLRDINKSMDVIIR